MCCNCAGRGVLPVSDALNLLRFRNITVFNPSLGDCVLLGVPILLHGARDGCERVHKSEVGHPITAARRDQWRPGPAEPRFLH